LLKKYSNKPKVETIWYWWSYLDKSPSYLCTNKICNTQHSMDEHLLQAYFRVVFLLPTIWYNGIWYIFYTYLILSSILNRHFVYWVNPCHYLKVELTGFSQFELRIAHGGHGFCPTKMKWGSCIEDLPDIISAVYYIGWVCSIGHIFSSKTTNRNDLMVSTNKICNTQHSMDEHLLQAYFRVVFLFIFIITNTSIWYQYITSLSITFIFIITNTSIWCQYIKTFYLIFRHMLFHLKYIVSSTFYAIHNIVWMNICYKLIFVLSSCYLQSDTNGIWYIFYTYLILSSILNRHFVPYQSPSYL
jgi:hypothetical protein